MSLIASTALAAVSLVFAPWAQEKLVPENAKKPAPAANSQEKAPASHLQGQSSPYLLQHLHNPVDWYPWGEEALARAKKEDKPIFLSIGYSACHWCHVMKRESFENKEIAKFLNEHFIAIKVDREERPDIDEIYMAATTKLNRGNGGWPMSVFLTPDLKPFYAGTYYPPSDRNGMPGFERILRGIHKVWTEKRDDVLEQAKRITAAIAADANKEGFGDINDKVLRLALTFAERRFDALHGGFGQGGFAPKFPHATELAFLLRYGQRSGSKKALEMASHTLASMARGGIYDQIGGGFHRYSVDREWLVPHFEKMLYDNAQLAVVYLEAWKATGTELFREIACEVLDYVAREMTSEEGGFWSTTDAESGGVEGQFFFWSTKELRSLLGEDADLAISWWGLTEQGNFEGHNILTRKRELADLAKESGKPIQEIESILKKAKATLYAARKQRVAPGLDDKILSSWNGLMLSAYARAARLLEGERGQRYLAIAEKNAAFLLSKMQSKEGWLWRTRRGDKAHLTAHLEDYAFVARGLLDLFEIDSDPRWLRSAQAFQAHMDAHYLDEHTGGYFSTGDYHKGLLVRMNSAQEGSLPSDVGVAATVAYRLGMLLGDEKLIERGLQLLRRHGAEVTHFPNAFGQLLLLADFVQARPEEAFVIGAAEDARTKALLKALRGDWPCYRLVIHVEPAELAAMQELLPTLKGKGLVEGKPAAFLCRLGSCRAPITDPKELSGGKSGR
ncbi:MAG: thioredoxin domain-containing protein [Planctomycetota bacterium]|nr:MAG: thioredoxin domain-containing protein [Planctomycetota bacterium]